MSFIRFGSRSRIQRGGDDPTRVCRNNSVPLVRHRTDRRMMKMLTVTDCGMLVKYWDNCIQSCSNIVAS